MGTETNPLLMVETTIVTPPAGHTTAEAWDAWYDELRVMGTAALDAFGVCPIDEYEGVPVVDDVDSMFEGTIVRSRAYRFEPFEVVLDDQIDTGQVFIEGERGNIVDTISPTGSQEVSVRRTLYVFVDNAAEIDADTFSSTAPQVVATIKHLQGWLR